ncbi:MAG: hypothetical protein QXR87_07050 [Candidatus Hadarchaeales archaeon]
MWEVSDTLFIELPARMGEEEEELRRGYSKSWPRRPWRGRWRRAGYYKS